ncbi:MAG: SEL1-like repeat protein [Limisphaerales bacterium]
MKPSLLTNLRRWLGGSSSEGSGQLSEEWQDTRTRAEKGEAEAQFDVGIGYVNGSIGTVDHTEAVKWLLKAAEQDMPEAQLAIGAHYHRGKGLPVNEPLATQWYRKAAEQGNRAAAFNLAYCYEVGEGVAKDVVEAFAWYGLWLKADSDPEAVAACADLAKRMTAEQMAAAKQRVEELRTHISATLRK